MSKKKRAKKLTKKKQSSPQRSKSQSLTRKEREIYDLLLAEQSEEALSRDIRAKRSKLQQQIRKKPANNLLRLQQAFYDLYLAEQSEQPAKKKKQAPAPQKRPKKKAPPTPAPSAGALKLAYGLLNDTWEKYPYLNIKATKSQIKAIDDEIRELQKPISNLKKRIKNASSRSKARKLKAELQTYEILIAEHIKGLQEQKTDLDLVEGQKEILRRAKKSIKSKIKTIEKKRMDAFENEDYDAFEKETYQLIKLEGTVANIDRYLGIITVTQAPPAPVSTEVDEHGNLEDPANPYTIWDAIAKLDEDLASGQWLYYIINSKRLAAANVIQIRIEAGAFWRSIKRSGTTTPRVDRVFNIETLTVKYTDYKG